jgi:hypothetical protein
VLFSIPLDALRFSVLSPSTAFFRLAALRLCKICADMLPNGMVLGALRLTGSPGLDLASSAMLHLHRQERHSVSGAATGRDGRATASALPTELAERGSGHLGDHQ